MNQTATADSLITAFQDRSAKIGFIGMGIDIFEVIEAAATKPFGFTA